MLRAASDVPPTETAGAPSIKTPSLKLGTAAPPGVSPIQLPSIRSAPMVPVRWMPLVKPVIDRPSTVLPPAEMSKPSAAESLTPLSWISIVALSPLAKWFFWACG